MSRDGTSAPGDTWVVGRSPPVEVDETEALVTDTLG